MDENVCDGYKDDDAGDETVAIKGQRLDDVLRILDIEVDNEVIMKSDDTESES
jgi:hypothetical protein